MVRWHHLGSRKAFSAGNNSGNSETVSTPKVLKGKRGQVEVEVPRDRNADRSSSLRRIERALTVWTKKLFLYAGGMTTREIQDI